MQIEPGKFGTANRLTYLDDDANNAASAEAGQ
jgi:hypothetical protein